MYCTVGVARTSTEGPKQYIVPLPASDTGQNFKDMLESGIGSDITFEVGEETFRAHKLILVALSPVFMDQFFGLIRNTNMDKVVVEDVEPTIFLESHLNCFMYALYYDV
ncbi:hypothetical protein IFM89_001348 [Coptis chinensis]|uniref:BTB domain-containing protein n=1 Tax=Coptis chinensis TaxID=261450 RepID=A0A835LL64_9MAGN|nr:hypothetical protein IFM89_001348 [Coptis chinensis]